MCGGGGGDQTVTNEPPAFVRPFLERALEEGEFLFDNNRLQFPQFSTVAGQTEDTLAAQDYLRNFATTAAPAAAQNAQAAINFNLDPGNLSPDSNPYLAQTAEAAIKPVFRELNESVIPGIGSQAVQAGAFTGVRPELLQGQAIDRAQEDAFDTTAGIFSDAYQQGRNQMLQAAALAPSVQGMGVLPGTLLDAIGQQNQMQDQALIDAGVQRHFFEQDAPYEELNRFANLALGQAGTGGQVTQPGPRGNPLTGALGGAATGAAIGSKFPGYGTAVGTGVGALIGLFGS